jgi:hypothetical protein
MDSPFGTVDYHVSKSGRDNSWVVYVNTFFEKRVEQLFELAGRVEQAFAAAQLDYRVIGGLAVYLYVEEVEPDAGRLTKDIDIVVRHDDLERIKAAAEPFDLQYAGAGGQSMLVQTEAPSNRRAVHLIVEPELGPCRIMSRVRVAPLAEIVRRKLTLFRLKDEMHLKDLDDAGLITPEIEAGLSAVLLERLAGTRARD